MFCVKLNDNKYSNVTDPIKKELDPSTGGQNGSFRAQKKFFWKKALKGLIRFF